MLYKMKTIFLMKPRIVKWLFVLVISTFMWFIYLSINHGKSSAAWNEIKISQDDPELIQLVREKYMIPPNYNTQYNLKKPRGRGVQVSADQSQGQVAIVKKLFDNAKTGFFIDCGANDGVYLSNTLWFEVNLGWNGLLIEADPVVFLKLKSKNRKAWLANVCLSPTIYPGSVPFYRNPNNTGINGLRERAEHGVSEKVIVDCFPLFTLLASINQFVVDVFSLDIEGFELQVLKTIPFDRILFKVFIIEYWPHAGGGSTLQTFMNSNGFKLFHKVNESLSRDSIYVHPSLLPDDFVEERYEPHE